MSAKYFIDVSDWYVDEWRNDINLYNECNQLFGDVPERSSGVYHIFKGGELLYVGCTVNFKSRITSHLVVSTNTKDFINEATHVKCYLIENKYEREIREYNDILQLKPSKNKKLPNLKIINRNKPID
jgi:excinuclease UvrABC nuclease subunit